MNHKAGCICVECERDIAERKAWDSLARYKFQMFGYWAAIWVHVNRLCPAKKPSPFSNLVVIACDQKAACARRKGAAA